MERKRKDKIIVVCMLLVGVLGLALGFAAFSNNLTITSSSEVQPLNSLKVVFSNSNMYQEELGENIETTLLPGDETTLYPGFTASIPIIDNSVISAPKLTNVKATFVRPGESVTYKLYIHNISSYDAQLSAIGFGSKQCIAKTGTSQSLVDGACDEIDISVTVGGGSDEAPAVTRTHSSNSNESIQNHILPSGEYETLEITLTYKNLSSNGGNTDVDGDFDVNFGDITLTYTSAS